MNLLFLQYNNYFNRIIKKETTLSAYTSNVDNKYVYFNNVNFNPNDGVSTEQIINWQEDWTPDYLVVFNDADEILTRWYVIDFSRTRVGQYKANLKRDTVSDYLDTVKNAPCYIEKATIRDSSNKLLLNSENMNLNQIKTTETLLKDYTHCSWIIGYYNKAQRENMTNITVDYNQDYGIKYTTVASIDTWEYKQYTSANPYIDLKDYSYIIASEGIIGRIGRYWFTYDNTGNYVSKVGKTGLSNVGIIMNLAAPTTSVKTAMTNNINSINAALKTDLSYTEGKGTAMLALNGTYIKDTTTGKIYKITVNSSLVEEKGLSVNANVRTTLFNALTNTIAPSGILVEGVTGNINNNTFNLNYTASNIWVSLTDVTSSYAATLSFKTSGSLLNTNDVPYNIFCIPVPDEGQKWRFSYDNNGVQAYSELFDKNMALQTAQSIAYQKGVGESAPIYDIQWLPYCPISNLFIEDTSSIPGFGDYVINTIITTTGTLSWVAVQDDTHKYLPVFEVPYSQFTGNINKVISIKNRGNTKYLDKKLSNECDMYRLCSPNFAAQFEFSIAKNNGVESFNYDCNYKPFAPYIHVNPNFKDLYGQDFNDARGLILSGDFSLPIVKDAWVTYEYQNKNYQNIFDRQIQNMEVTQDIQKTQQIWSTIGGAITGAAAGAKTGSSFGGGVGGVVGAGVGAAVSTVGGIADYQLLLKSQQEAMSYTTDMYNYNLQNIKAMPDTLTKVGAFNGNYKVYPLVEYYTCSEEEEQALTNKLLYNGMTIMAIDNINNYIIENEKQFIQGKLIRLLNINGNAQIANDIYQEISRGVYM